MSEQATTPAPANKPKSDQIEIGALWKKEGRSQKFLAGNLDFKNLTEEQWKDFLRTKQLQAVVFTNKFKQNERHPDLRIYLSKPKEQAAPAAAPSEAPATPAPAAAEGDGEII